MARENAELQVPEITCTPIRKSWSPRNSSQHAQNNIDIGLTRLSQVELDGILRAQAELAHATDMLLRDIHCARTAPAATEVRRATQSGMARFLTMTAWPLTKHDSRRDPV
jgi:hypothetical protein